jgi:hypothetical protein
MGIALPKRHIHLALQHWTMDRSPIENDDTTAARWKCSTSSLLEPLPKDILCGRDRNYTKHPGNQIYRRLLEEQSSKYETHLSKVSKMEVTKYIVGTMQQQYGSRFIRRTTEGWEELSNTQARDKTSHALRFLHNKHSIQKAERCSRGDPSHFIHREGALAGTSMDTNQAVLKSNLSIRDSFETIDNSNIATESPLSRDIWIDQSYVRDDFGVFHDMIDYDSPHSHRSGLQSSDYNKVNDPPDESSIFRKPSR